MGTKHWEYEFDIEKKKILRIVAEYYFHKGKYYSDVSGAILEDEDYIPSKKLYHRMCLNKYAQRVLKETLKEPKYHVSQLVYPSAKAPTKISRALSRGGIVLRTNAAPVIDSVKGSKRYLVLPIGRPDAIIIEERWLRKTKSKKTVPPQLRLFVLTTASFPSIDL